MGEDNNEGTVTNDEKKLNKEEEVIVNLEKEIEWLFRGGREFSNEEIDKGVREIYWQSKNEVNMK